jgi:hypothetical protein
MNSMVSERVQDGSQGVKDHWCIDALDIRGDHVVGRTI